MAIKKKIIKKGKLDTGFGSLKYHPENITSGISQSVLPSFRVVATFKDSSPEMEAAPITDAVSCIANENQVPA